LCAKELKVCLCNKDKLPLFLKGESFLKCLSILEGYYILDVIVLIDVNDDDSTLMMLIVCC
jgi:hypothetical protein